MNVSRQSSRPRTFGLPEAGVDEQVETIAEPTGKRRLLGKISLSSFKNARSSFSIGKNATESNTERPPIPTMMKPSGEIYSTPLPKLPMIVLSIVRSKVLSRKYRY